MLRLKTKIPAMKDVSQICFPRETKTNYQNCFVMGWGLTNITGTKWVDDLYELAIKILDNKVCEESYTNFNGTTMICAGYVEGGKDSCLGDSGGPLICAKDGDPTRMYLEGAVSYGKGCAQKSYPGIYSRIRYYLNWIEAYADSDDQIPPRNPILK